MGKGQLRCSRPRARLTRESDYDTLEGCERFVGQCTGETDRAQGAVCNAKGYGAMQAVRATADLQEHELRTVSSFLGGALMSFEMASKSAQL